MIVALVALFPQTWSGIWYEADTYLWNTGCMVVWTSGFDPKVQLDLSIFLEGQFYPESSSLCGGTAEHVGRLELWMWFSFGIADTFDISY